MDIEQAKKMFPVGQDVVFQPVAGVQKGKISKIRSEPWVLGSGHIVTAIEGRAGGVSINHLLEVSNG